MAYVPRTHIAKEELNVATIAVYDAYEALTVSERAQLRNSLYLCDETVTEMGYGYAEMASPEDFLAGIPAFEGNLNGGEALAASLGESDKLALAEYCYSILNETSVATFCTIEGLVLISEARGLFWVEESYLLLTEGEKGMFQTDVLLHPETVLGGEALFAALSEADKLDLTEKCYEALGTGQTTFLTDESLYPQTLQGCKDLDDALTFGTQQLDMAKYAYSILTGLEPSNFLLSIDAMLIADAQTEVWAESCYNGLSLSDQVLFLENIHADAETLAGIVHGYNHLVAADQLAAFETFCANLREKPNYYNVIFKH